MATAHRLSFSLRTMLATYLLALALAGPLIAATVPIDRIVGGEPTTIEEHPHQVAVLLDLRFHCGGSLIAPNFVLTACHCIQ